MKRGDPIARTPMRRKPARRTSEETRARRLVRDRAEGRCEGCGRAPGVEWAHRVSRAQGGPWCPSNGLLLCGPGGCHHWSHLNPEAARQWGWMLRRHQDPATSPVLHAWHGWVYLGADGSVTPVTDREAA